MKQSEKGKVKWYLLLFIAVILFLTAMATQQLFLNVIVIGLAVYIYKYGNPILFKEYDEKRKMKLKESMVVREAAKEALNSGNLFRRK
ncbi:hypothetical protein [Enterococcus sp.]|uniref:hypothetical protein n=1 Tax=Enterococcus sp. TaxID=35783 RepID=UPI00291224BD|nr:hypothetical protein [Enterococcus sp.]MDU5337230.1 hypothetical protein [Enterococcus sp.]